MNIQLTQAEIEKAIVAYIANEGIDLDNQEVSVEMTAGRKGNGHTAQVTIGRVEGSDNADATTDDDDADTDSATDKKLF